MYLEITDASATLRDVWGFTSFSARTDLAGDALRRALESHVEAGSWGHFDGEHVWVSCAALRASAPLEGGEPSGEWLGKLEGMLEYAASKGWVDEAGEHVRAHVEGLDVQDR